MDRKLDEAVTYFKEKKSYHNLFLLFRKKYESLGRFGGSIQLDHFSNEEIEEFALFSGISPHHLVREGKLMLSDFEQFLQQSRFAGISLHELLEEYFGEKLQSKKSAKEKLSAEQIEKLAYLKQTYPHIADWFTYLEGRTSDTYWIWRLLLEPGFTEDVQIIAHAYSALPDSIERYPLFSQRVAGNPHALDLDTVRGKLWVHLLHVMAGGQGALPSQAEPLNELLHHYNLLRDDIQNFVTQANLLAYIGDHEHPVWRSAIEERCVMNVPMRELLKIDKVIAAHTHQSPMAQGFQVTSYKKVYVVENSGVFSALLDEVPNAPLICTHGQFKLAALQLLDMLSTAGHTLYYSGDFDPEGLSMAIRFKKRYGNQAQFWHMTVADYFASTPTVELGSREDRLTSIFNSELGEVALALKKTAKAGYQEGIITLLTNDLQNWMDEGNTNQEEK